MVAERAQRARRPRPKAWIDVDGCTGCEWCVDFCPVDCIDKIDDPDYAGDGTHQVVIVDGYLYWCTICARNAPGNYSHDLRCRGRGTPERRDCLGIHLKRDSRSSIAYSEELISATISATLQSTDRHHGLWAKSVVIFNSLREHGKQSVRRLAERTGLSKSSLSVTSRQSSARPLPRVVVVGNGGRPNLIIRLVVATLFVFGLKRGVGAETLSAFFGCFTWKRMWAARPAPCDTSCTCWSVSC